MIKHEKLIHTISVLAYLALILLYTILSMQNGTESAQTSSNVAEGIANVQETVTGKPVKVTPGYELSVRKLVGHYGIFLFIGIASSATYLLIPYKRKWLLAIIHFATGFIYAAITEFYFQGNAEGRSPTLKDTMLDYAGFITLSILIVAGYLIWYYIFYKKRLRRA